MTALDRALIKAYRATGKAHASAYAQAQPAAATQVATFAQHGSEPVLAGPHWHRRPNVLQQATAEAPAVAMDSLRDSKPAGVANSNSPVHTAESVAAGTANPLVTTFRMDVGMVGVPSAPNLPASVPAIPVGVPTVAPVGQALPLTQAVPLSQTAQQSSQSAVVTDTAKPHWVVDEFLWPTEVCQLADMAAPALDQWIEKLRGNAKRPSDRMLAVVGVEPGVGTSSTVLALARRAISAGLRPAIVDANASRPDLANQLSVLATTGWEAVVAGRQSLGAALIESVRDRAVLLPLTAGTDSREPLQRTTVRHTLPWQILATEYSIILFDCGNCEHDGDVPALKALCEVAGMPGVHAVCDARSTTPDEMITFSRRLKNWGLRVLGTIENFVNLASLGHDVA